MRFQQYLPVALIWIVPFKKTFLLFPVCRVTHCPLQVLFNDVSLIHYLRGPSSSSINVNSQSLEYSPGTRSLYSKRQKFRYQNLHSTETEMLRVVFRDFANQIINGLSFTSSRFIILSCTEHIKCQTIHKFWNMVNTSQDSSEICGAKIRIVVNQIKMYRCMKHFY